MAATCFMTMAGCSARSRPNSGLSSSASWALSRLRKIASGITSSMKALRRMARVPIIMRRPVNIMAAVSRAPCLPCAKVHSSDKLITRAGAMIAIWVAIRPPRKCPTR